MRGIAKDAPSFSHVKWFYAPEQDVRNTSFSLHVAGLGQRQSEVEWFSGLAYKFQQNLRNLGKCTITSVDTHILHLIYSQKIPDWNIHFQG